MQLASLRLKLTPATLVVGIGNELRGDDAAGPELIRRIHSTGNAAGRRDIRYLDAGAVPENHLGKIIRHEPDTILIIDAVDFSGTPGSIKIIEHTGIENSSISTHNSSLLLTIEYLKQCTKADIILLGIQPLNLEPDSGLSEPVNRAIDEIIRILH